MAETKNVTSKKPTKNRPNYGSGQLVEIGPSYYGLWYDDEWKRIQRTLGKVPTEGGADGLAKAMAEEKLRDIRAKTGRLVSLEVALVFDGGAVGAVKALA